ncbi:MAG: hypothetical protein JWO80_773 [Bryobacterales bacterium]|nr:hypothetical protein [Bryobacterales bacterium]
MTLSRVCSIIAFLAGSLAYGQVAGSGTIQGTVSDPTGAVIGGASVTATNTATGVQTVRQATAAGFFVLSPLPAGEYRVTVTATGFQSLVQEHIVVDALATVGLNPTLNVGAAAETVTVSGAPPVLQTDDATLGVTMQNNVYDSLPLAMNGGPRDPTQFVNLIPGVQAGQTQAAGTSFASFNGGQTYQNEVYIEGIPMTNAAAQGETRNLSLGISVEAIDQFQVETNGAKAMYEGQGVENYVLKSGTDQFHGAAYEYFRNTALDARGFFPATTPVEHQNQFGANVGGPIRKNKAFFFGSYDGYKYKTQSVPVLQSIPTLAERNGDFSAFPVTIYDPATTVCSAAGICTRTAFAGNIIPASRLSNAAKSLQSYLPNPQNGAIQNNYLASLPIGLGVNNTTDKVDVNLSDKNRFFALFSKGKYSTDGLASITTGAQIPLPYTDSRIVQENATTAQFHDVYVFTPNLLNQFSYSFARLYVPIISATAAGKYPQKAGITGLPPGQASDSFPDVTFNGSNVPVSWAGTNAHAFDEAINTFVLQDNIQWVRGRHNVTFGFQVQWLEDNYTAADTGSLAGFTFSNLETAGFAAGGGTTPVASTGNGYASYLLGAVDSASITQNTVVTTGARYHDYAAYMQDDFKVSPRLTLNLGLRYDLFGPFHETLNRMSFLNPTLPNPAIGGFPGALQFAGNGDDSCHCDTPVKTHYLNFAPRLGAAYRLNDKTVLRAGYAVTYAHAGGISGRAGGRAGTGQLGYNASPSLSSPNGGTTPAFYLDQGVPPYQQPPFISPTLNTGATTANPTPGAGLTYADPSIGGKGPVYNNWNAGIQRALSPNMTLGVTYTASNGHFLAGAGHGIYTNAVMPRYLALGTLLNAPANAANIAAANAIVPGIGLPYSNFSGTIGQMLRPFPQYAAISDIWGDVGNSTFNALQVTFQRRLASGFTFLIGYTFSKEIDNIAGSRTPYNAALDKAVGALDRTHVFNATFVYQLPFGSGHTLGNGNALVRSLVSGWQISGLITFTSGAPLAIVASNCTTGTVGGTCFPNYNPSFSGPARINGNYGSGNVLGSRPNTYIDKTAFVDPAPFTFGNIARELPFGLRDTPTFDQDLSLRREFKVWERVNFALQADVFNVTNAVRFSGIGANVDSASFGTVSTQGNIPRKFQLSARITF